MIGPVDLAPATTLAIETPAPRKYDTAPCCVPLAGLPSML